MINNEISSFFAQPKFLVGNRALEHIHLELDGYNASRPMVITNEKNSRSLLKRFIRSLADSNIVIGAVYDNALPYVNMEEIKRLSGLFQWRGCDSIIALGGDSVMDIAKSLNLSINKVMLSEPLHTPNPLTPLVYIAAPSFNGLEVTNSINIDGKSYKSDRLFPDVICVDKRMVTPIKEMHKLVHVAVDSITHCVEGIEADYYNPFIDAMAFSAIRLIIDNLKLIIKNSKNKEAALGLINGISIAGVVGSNNRKSIVSLVSNCLATETGISRGIFSGILLTQYLHYKIDSGVELRDKLLLSLVGIDDFCSISKGDRGKEAIKEITKLIVSLSNYFPDNLKALNVQEHLLASTSIQVNVLSQGRISYENCLNFLQKAYNN